MKKFSVVIELYSPGIVIFDPEVLTGFLAVHNIRESDIFEVFIREEILGRAAIDQGVIFPIYQIPQDKYSVFLLSDSVKADALPKPIFSYSGIPLRIESEVLIVADLNALFDWDEDFFRNYKAGYKSKLENSGYIDVANGLYSISIEGYVGLDTLGGSLGYGIRMNPVSKLPRLNEDISIDQMNFVLT